MRAFLPAFLPEDSYTVSIQCTYCIYCRSSTEEFPSEVQMALSELKEYHPDNFLHLQRKRAERRSTLNRRECEIHHWFGWDGVDPQTRPGRECITLVLLRRRESWIVSPFGSRHCAFGCTRLWYSSKEDLICTLVCEP